MRDPRGTYGDRGISLLSLALVASVAAAVISMIMAVIAGADLLLALTTYIITGAGTLLFVICIPLLALALSRGARSSPWTHHGSNTQSHGSAIPSVKSDIQRYKWCCKEGCYRCSITQGRHY